MRKDVLDRKYGNFWSTPSEIQDYPNYVERLCPYCGLDRGHYGPAAHDPIAVAAHWLFTEYHRPNYLPCQRGLHLLCYRCDACGGLWTVVNNAVVETVLILPGWVQAAD